MSLAARLDRPWSLPRWEFVGVLVGICLLEALALAVYLWTVPAGVTAWRYLLYPFVWLNVAVLAVVRTPVPSAPSRRRALAALVGVGYFLGLAAIDGTIALSPGTGLTVHWALPPGWGPLVIADVGPLRVAPIPYRTLGYAAIAYLLAVTLLDRSLRGLGGLVGLVSCVSCTLPVLAAILSGVAGGSVAAAATTLSYDLSTVVFLVTVGVLAWQTDR